MGFSLKKALKVPKLSSIIKNPVKQLVKGDLIPGLAGQSPLGFIGSAGAKSIKDKLTAPLPEVPYFGEPRAIQDKLIGNQLSAADEYSRSIPQTLNSEMSLERSRIGDELNQAQRQARGSANSRGMLFSGQRMAQEGNLAGQASSQLADARAKAIQRVLGQQQSMYAQPLQSRANIAETNMQQRGLLDKYKQETDQMRTGLISAGLGNVGAGIGQGLGNMNEGYNFSGRTYRG